MTERGSPRASDCPSEAQVLDHVQGQLGAETSAGVELHAAGCADCRDLIEWLRAEVNRDSAKASPRADAATAATADAQAMVSAFLGAPAELAGRLIAGKYKLGRALGSGGMGQVYEAVNTWTERRVAVKLLHPHFSADAETVSRFRLEAKSAVRVQHASIVEVLDLGQDPSDGSLYMVQELLDGDTLRQRLRAKGRFPVAEALSMLLPIMDGLAAAHQAGVVHRDVKPENIILSIDRAGREVPKLIDFGISKVIASEIASMLQTGRALGTPLYMSPEQLRAKEVDGRADVWAVGVVLFELLAGARPFAAASNADLAVQILTTVAPSVRSRVPEVAEDVAAVVARALEPDVNTRFPTMRAMLEALLACPSLANGDQPSGRSRAIDAELARPSAPSSPRRAYLRYVVAAALLLAAALTAWGVAGARQRLADSRAPSPPTAERTRAAQLPVAVAPLAQVPGAAAPSPPPSPVVAERSSPVSPVAPARTSRPSRTAATSRRPTSALSREPSQPAPLPSSSPARPNETPPAKWAPMLDL